MIIVIFISIININNKVTHLPQLFAFYSQRINHLQNAIFGSEIALDIFVFGKVLPFTNFPPTNKINSNIFSFFNQATTRRNYDGILLYIYQFQIKHRRLLLFHTFSYSNNQIILFVPRCPYLIRIYHPH